MTAELRWLEPTNRRSPLPFTFGDAVECTLCFQRLVNFSYYREYACIFNIDLSQYSMSSF